MTPRALIRLSILCSVMATGLTPAWADELADFLRAEPPKPGVERAAHEKMTACVDEKIAAADRAALLTVLKAAKAGPGQVDAAALELRRLAERNRREGGTGPAEESAGWSEDPNEIECG